MQSSEKLLRDGKEWTIANVGLLRPQQPGQVNQVHGIRARSNLLLSMSSLIWTPSLLLLSEPRLWDFHGLLPCTAISGPWVPDRYPWSLFWCSGAYCVGRRSTVTARAALVLVKLWHQLSSPVSTYTRNEVAQPFTICIGMGGNALFSSVLSFAAGPDQSPHNSDETTKWSTQNLSSLLTSSPFFSPHWNQACRSRSSLLSTWIMLPEGLEVNVNSWGVHSEDWL